jgi:drug/metabolite transporter (DMT)-like permease
LRVQLICIAIAALTWGGYPLIARASGVGRPIGALVLTVCALLPISIASLWSGPIVRLTAAELVRLAAAGVLMGIGTLAFNFVVNSREIEASVSIPLIDTTMLLVSVVGAIIFFAEPVTAKKAIGVVFLIAGILMLKPK